ncbi:MAG: aldehyde dehydrogenase family protein [Cyclobacteriaceae bacterium]|nr:aldehyde dehydrogenase family protein [Cyclobacteriaceae bacterium]
MTSLAPPLTLQETFNRLKVRSGVLRNEPLSSRKKRLRDLESWLHANRERIRAAVHADYRKPFLEVDTSEIYPVLSELRLALARLNQWAAPVKIDAPLSYLGSRAEVRFEPKGTCLIIAPWNFPFNLTLGPLVSCLAAGNNAIIKPSEMTPHTSALIKELATEVFEADIVSVVEGGVEVSQQLLDLPFDHIFFTGSTAVGRVVMEAASRHLASVTLELGGKSPTVIDKTARLEDTARRIAFGKFLNNGQTCIAPDYILIDAAVRERFLTLLKKEIRNIFGDGQDISEQSASYSRLATPKQYHRLNALLADAVQRGAHADPLGPSNEKERFMAPVILTDVPPDAQLWQEEIFGPLLPVESYTDTAAVISRINKGPKPLALYVFSQDRAFQEQVLQQTTSGSACVNDCVLQFTHPHLPFGGVNHSGIGKSHGHHGFLAFSNEKSVLRQKNGFAGPYLLYPPYTKGMKKIVDALLKWF